LFATLLLWLRRKTGKHS